MNPVQFAMRRPFITLMLVVALASVGILGLSKERDDLFRRLNTPKVHSYLDYVGTCAKQMKDYIVGQYESYFHKHEEHHGEHAKIVVTSPKAMDVTITQQYVCQIRSQQPHRRLCLGQRVSRGDLHQGGPGGEEGRCDVQDPASSLQGKGGRRVGRGQDRATGVRATPRSCHKDKVVSENEVQLFEAKRDRAKAKAGLAKAELSFTKVVAPFDGIVDRQHKQLGSLIHEGEILTTLSDNSVMWVYFNVPEKQYLEYTASSKQDRENQKIELELANKRSSRSPASTSRSRANSTTRPGTSPSARIFRTRTACCVTVRPAPS